MYKKKSLLFHRIKRKWLSLCFAAFCLISLAVPVFASSGSAFVDASGVISPTAFDPLSDAVMANIGAVMPKILIIVAIFIAITFAIVMFKKHARPS